MPPSGAAEQMDVQVIDFLSAVLVAVDDEPVAVLGDALVPREVARHGEHVADERLVIVADVVGGRNRLVWHDQDMDRRTRMDVAEGRHAFVPVQDRGRQFARDDALEQCRHPEILTPAAPNLHVKVDNPPVAGMVP